MATSTPPVTPDVRAARSRAGHASAAALSPEQRTERARHAAAARGSADYHLRKLAESASTLTADQVDRLAEILRPAIASLVSPRDAQGRAEA